MEEMTENYRANECQNACVTQLLALGSIIFVLQGQSHLGHFCAREWQELGNLSFGDD